MLSRHSLRGQFDGYRERTYQALGSIDFDQLLRVRTVLVKAMKEGKRIYSCGNGGSAAIADHLVCDCMKGVAWDTKLKARVHSLASNGPLITAIANDSNYDRIFAFQVHWLGEPGDVLLAFSVSGASENMLGAISTALGMDMKVAVFTSNAQRIISHPGVLTLTIRDQNYGICEDVMQSLMHILSQSIRLEFATGEVRL